MGSLATTKLSRSMEVTIPVMIFLSFPSAVRAEREGERGREEGEGRGGGERGERGRGRGEGGGVCGDCH